MWMLGHDGRVLPVLCRSRGWINVELGNGVDVGTRVGLDGMLGGSSSGAIDAAGARVVKRRL